MEYAYATCILGETGEEINEENLTAVLEAAGCSVIESRVKAIVAALEDVDVAEVAAIDVEGEDDEPSGAPGPVGGDDGEADVGDFEEADDERPEEADGEELGEAGESTTNEEQFAENTVTPVSAKQEDGDRKSETLEEPSGTEPSEER